MDVDEGRQTCSEATAVVITLGCGLVVFGYCFLSTMSGTYNKVCLALTFTSGSLVLNLMTF